MESEPGSPRLPLEPASSSGIPAMQPCWDKSQEWSILLKGKKTTLRWRWCPYGTHSCCSPVRPCPAQPAAAAGIVATASMEFGCCTSLGSPVILSKTHFLGQGTVHSIELSQANQSSSSLTPEKSQATVYPENKSVLVLISFLEVSFRVSKTSVTAVLTQPPTPWLCFKWNTSR